MGPHNRELKLTSARYTYVLISETSVILRTNNVHYFSKTESRCYKALA